MKKITLVFLVLFCTLSYAQCWQSVSSGYQSTLAIKSDGTLWAWGDNDFGQLGTGNFAPKNSPVQVGTESNWKEISCGENHVVAIKTDGTLWAWGDNFAGQLGDGGIVNMSNVPIQISNDTDWQTISAGSSHTLALKTNGTLWGWGWNFAAQVGDGTTVDVLMPIQIAVGSTFKAIGTGAYFSHAIKTDGTLWGWGDNSFGQMGDGTTNFNMVPTQIGTANNWKSIDGGDSYAVAIKTNGTLWSWGANYEGNLGDGTLIDRLNPMQIGTDTNWKSVSTKFYHVSALKNNGTLWTWGFNTFGQMGDATNVQKSVPTQVGTATNWLFSSAGVYHSMAVNNDGVIVGSGDDQFLQLGNGTGPTTNTFVVIGTCVSKIQNAQCGATLTSINQQVYANPIAVAQGYRFKVTDLVTNQVQTIDRVLRVFQLTQLGSYAFDRAYSVEVSIKYNNVWQPYLGLPCVVTTPATTTTVQSVQCGSTLSAMNDVIYADNVPHATGYKFRITNLLTSEQEEIIRPIRDVRMTNFSNPEYNSTYTIEVAIKNTNGVYLPYGAVCMITTPSFPTSQLQASQCDIVVTNMNTPIFADPFSGASTYRFRFTSGTFVYVIDRPTRSFVLSAVPGLLPSSVYTVQVSLEVNGVFGPYGKTCTITTPGSAKTSNDLSTPLKVFSYPNPFVDSFQLEMNTSLDAKVEVKVYDMMGKLVETRSTEVAQISELQLGATYPSGIYNVSIIQGENVKTVRVIKR